MIQYTLTPTEQERATTIRSNLKRSKLTTLDFANHFGNSRALVQDALKGRYGTGTTNTWFTKYEEYLLNVLGVRYIQSYFNDLD